MRIIHINDKLSISGGVEVYISQVQKLLNTRGIECDWVAIQRNGKHVTIESTNPRLDWSGAACDLLSSPLGEVGSVGATVLHVHSLSEPRVLEALFEMAPVIRTMHEPRLFCPGQGKFWAGPELACNIPFGAHCLVDAYTKRCCNRHPKRLLRQFANTRYEVKSASAQYAALLANSTYTQSEALKVGISPVRLELLHYFTPTMETPASAETSGTRLLYIGRLSRTKGVHYMLSAFKQVLAKNSAVVLDLIGSGHDESFFRNQAKALGVADAVNFLGWGGRVEIDQAIAASDIVLFPSVYPEAFGIVGIEAMMRGKPVVGFDVGGVKDWLRHEETGLLVPVKDTQAFADAVIRLLDDDELRIRMGKRAREIALAEFSEEVHIQKLIKIYEAALSCD